MNHSINTALFEIEPGNSTKWQNHSELELVMCIEGEVEAHNGVTGRMLKAGEAVLFSSLESHRLLNHTDQKSKMRTFWWHGRPPFQIRKELNDAKLVTKESQNYLILPSFITPNGKMHLGHLAGPLISSDILRRILSYSKRSVTYLGGSIGYQTHVDVAAKNNNRSYKELSLQNSRQFVETNQLMGIGSGAFTTLDSSSEFHEISKNIIRSFIERGYTVERTKEVPYCNRHGFLFEAYVRGKCPHCGSELSSECEACGVFVADHEIEQAVCQSCESNVEYSNLTRLYLPLEPWRQVLEKLIMQDAFTGNALDFVGDVLEGQLPEVPLSIIAENGIPLPHEGYTDHVLYSAVELICRFAISFKQNTGSIPNEDLDKNYKIALFFGADNNYLRCIIFPILVHLLTNGKVQAGWFYSNEFYLLDGIKFSTGRNHVIYADEIVKQGVPKDWLRLYLARTWPENLETNFSIHEFEAFSMKRANQIQIAVGSIYTFLNSRYNGKIPEGGTWDRSHLKFVEILTDWQKEIWSSYQVNSFSPNHVARKVESGLDLLYDFTLRILKPRTNKSLERTGVMLACSGLHLVAEMIYPVMPDFAVNLVQCVDINQDQIEMTEERFGLHWFTGNTFNKIKLQ